MKKLFLILFLLSIACYVSLDCAPKAHKHENAFKSSQGLFETSALAPKGRSSLFKKSQWDYQEASPLEPFTEKQRAPLSLEQEILYIERMLNRSTPTRPRAREYPLIEMPYVMVMPRPIEVSYAAKYLRPQFRTIEE